MPPESDLEVSVVAAAHNEQDNVTTLVEEVHALLEPEGMAFEMIVVDDGSTDRTRERLQTLLDRFDGLRVIRMLDTPPGRGNGQSAAFKVGIAAARGEVVVLLDADLQNDPADIPPMLRELERSGADMVQGDRSADRRDGLVRRVSSRVGRLFRRMLLGDTIRDTGCSLRVMRRRLAAALPLEFKGMHRFIPVTARQLGYRVVEVPVHHRPRTAGETKYGIRNRALSGLRDCFAVRWMRSRRRPLTSEEVERTRESPSVTAPPRKRVM